MSTTEALEHFLALDFEKNLPILVVGSAQSTPTTVFDVAKTLKTEQSYECVDVLLTAQQQQQSDSTLSFDGKIIEHDSANIKRETYDVVLITDDVSVCEDGCELLDKLIIASKRGGFVCWTMSNKNDTLERFIESKCDRCKWISMLGFPRRSPSNSTILYAMQVV